MDDLIVGCSACPGDTLSLSPYRAFIACQIVEDESAIVHLAANDVEKIYRYLGSWLERHRSLSSVESGGEPSAEEV
jgi:hypothetical protein